MSTHGEAHDDFTQLIKLNGGSHVHTFYKICRDGKYFFMKRLRPEYASQEYYRQTFRKEYELGSSLQSEYIVRYHQLVDAPTECSLIMDYVNGSTLADFLRNHPDYFHQTNHLRKFLQQLCLALQELHRHQALHLDLKPSNIMLTAVNNDVRLIDLGCSYTDARPSTIGLSRHFAAPEQLDGSYDVDARTDIYALGRILLEMDATSPLPKGFREMARRCAAEQKENRFQSVNEILDFLKQPHRRHKFLPIVLTVAVFAAILIISLPFWGGPGGGSEGAGVGSTFIDTSNPDTLHLQILSVADRQVAVVPPPKGSKPCGGDIVLPDSVVYNGRTYYITAIADSAFFGCHELDNIHFPPTLLTIGHKAFEGCRRLGNIHLPSSVVSVGHDAFFNCRSLRHVAWPASATEVPGTCFHACRSLKSITLPEGVTVIHQDAFCDCRSLEEVDLPSTLQRIDRGAFYQCTSLRTITLPASITQLGEYLFYRCPKLQEIRLLATTPPYISTIVEPSFRGVIRVPTASLEAYKKAPGWKNLNLAPL